MAIARKNVLNQTNWEGIEKFLSNYLDVLKAKKSSLDKETRELNSSIIAFAGHAPKKMAKRMVDIKDDIATVNKEIDEYSRLLKNISTINRDSRQRWANSSSAERNNIISRNSDLIKDSIDTLLDKSNGNTDIARMLDAFYTNVGKSNSVELSSALSALEQDMAYTRDAIKSENDKEAKEALKNHLYEVSLKLDFAKKKQAETSISEKEESERLKRQAVEREQAIAQRKTEQEQKNAQKKQEREEKARQRAEEKNNSEAIRNAARPVLTRSQKKVLGKNYNPEDYNNSTDYLSLKNAFVNNIRTPHQYVALNDPQAPNAYRKNFSQKMENVRSNVGEKVGITKMSYIRRSNPFKRMLGHLGRHITEISFVALAASLLVVPQLVGAAHMVNVFTGLLAATAAVGTVNFAVYGNFPAPFVFTKYSKARKSYLKHRFEKARFDILPNELEIANRKTKKVSANFDRFMKNVTIDKDGNLSYDADTLAKMQAELDGKPLGIVRRVSRFAKRIPIIGFFAKKVGVVNRFVDQGSILDLNEYSEKYAKKHIFDVCDEYAQRVKPDDKKGLQFLSKLREQRCFIEKQLNNVNKSANAMNKTLNAFSMIQSIDAHIASGNLSEQDRETLQKDRDALISHIAQVKSENSHFNAMDEVSERKFARVNGENIRYVNQQLERVARLGLGSLSKEQYEEYKVYKKKIIDRFGACKWEEYKNYDHSEQGTSMVYTTQPSLTREAQPATQTIAPRQTVSVATNQEPVHRPVITTLDEELRNQQQTTPARNTATTARNTAVANSASTPMAENTTQKPSSDVQATANTEKPRRNTSARIKSRKDYRITTLKNGNTKIVEKTLNEDGTTSVRKFVFTEKAAVGLFLNPKTGEITM